MTNGIELVRQALATYGKKHHFGWLAREVGTGASALEDWAYNREAKLAPEVVAKLVKYLFHGQAELRADGVLYSVGSDPQPLDSVPDVEPGRRRA